MSKNKKNRKQKPYNTQTPDENKYVCISKNELKELIISAVKEEKAQEDDPSLSDISSFTQFFVIFLYFIFYCVFTMIIYESFSARIIPNDEIPHIIIYIGLDLITIWLGYTIAKNKSKNDISQHFSVLTTIIALCIAVFAG